MYVNINSLGCFVGFWVLGFVLFCMGRIWTTNLCGSTPSVQAPNQCVIQICAQLCLGALNNFSYLGWYGWSLSWVPFAYIMIQKISLIDYSLKILLKEIDGLLFISKTLFFPNCAYSQLIKLIFYNLFAHQACKKNGF